MQGLFLNTSAQLMKAKLIRSNFNEKTGLISETEYDYKGQLLEERFFLYLKTGERKNTGTWKKYKDGKLTEQTKQ